MNEYILSDLFRYYGKTDLITFIRAILKNRTFRFQVAFRLCQSKGISKYIGYIMYVFNHTKKNIILSRHTKVGYGLYIGHGGPIVVNSTAVIGNNVNFHNLLLLELITVKRLP